jgi:hypothetical protein
MIAALPVLVVLAALITLAASLFAPVFLLAAVLVLLAANRGRRAKQAFWLAIYPLIVYAFVVGTIFEIAADWCRLAIGLIVAPVFVLWDGAREGHAGWKRGARALGIFGLLVSLHLGYDYSQPAQVLMLNSGLAPAGPVNAATYVRPVLVVTWSRR